MRPAHPAPRGNSIGSPEAEGCGYTTEQEASGPGHSRRPQALLGSPFFSGGLTPPVWPDLPVDDAEGSSRRLRAL